MISFPSFFFDTADTDYIRKTWDRLKGSVKPSSIVGITTNPNAMAKVNCHDKVDFERRIREMCELVSELRGTPGGIVYVQYPSSQVDIVTLIKFARWISSFNDNYTYVGLKIPPFLPILENVESLRQYCEINVTGVADCSTALMCLTYPIDYLSIIPGRMEEKGLNANDHLLYLSQRHHMNNAGNPTRIITGSMRTLRGLEDAIRYGTVPTIGSRVFDLVLEKGEGAGEYFRSLWDQDSVTSHLSFSPTVSEVSTQLSVDFFKQMDDMGSKLFDNLKGDNYGGR